MMFDKVQFISLGPNCHTAGVLEILGLRKFSLPFDWAQSGSIQHAEILDLTAESFYYRHIHSPSRIMSYHRIGDVDENGHAHGCIKEVQNIYGYSVFFNPHRPEGTEKEYFIRCIKRLQDQLRQKEKEIILILADHLTLNSNQELIPSPITAVNFIRKIFEGRILAPFKIVVMKTYTSSQLESSISRKRMSDEDCLLEIKIPSTLDSFSNSSENNYFLKKLYHKALTCAIISKD